MAWGFEGGIIPPLLQPIYRRPLPGKAHLVTCAAIVPSRISGGPELMGPVRNWYGTASLNQRGDHPEESECSSLPFSRPRGPGWDSTRALL